MTDVAASHRLDSGIDVSAYKDDDSECDILDLDRISLLDEDEERWLCAPKTKKDSTDSDDVMSWLRKKACSLDQKSRQTLIRKLDAIAKKNDGAQLEKNELNLGDTLKVAHPLNGLKVDKRPSIDSNTSEEDTFFDAVDDHERDLAAKLHETIKAQNQCPQTEPQKGDGVRPHKMVIEQPHLQFPTEISTPDFLASEASFAVGNNIGCTRPSLVNGHPPIQSQTSNGSVRSKESSPSPRFDKHVELNPELQDIHLLASMQEDDLRQCLQRMQLQRRKRTESANSDNAPAPTNLHSVNGHGSGHGGGVSRAALDQLAAALGKNTNDAKASRPSQSKRDDKYKTYSKRSHNAGSASNVVISTPGRRSAPTTHQPSTLSVSNRRVSEPKRNAIDPPSHKNIINSSIFTQSQSLQKSLPNLASSKSAELSLSRECGTSSEKGSYSDIPDSVSPTHSADKTPVKPVNTSRLRMPTPRSRLVTPGKTSIPAPSSSKKSFNRFKSPAPVSRPQIPDNWKEDCF